MIMGQYISSIILAVLTSLLNIVSLDPMPDSPYIPTIPSIYDIKVAFDKYLESETGGNAHYEDVSRMTDTIRNAETFHCAISEFKHAYERKTEQETSSSLAFFVFSAILYFVTAYAFYTDTLWIVLFVVASVFTWIIALKFDKKRKAPVNGFDEAPFGDTLESMNDYMKSLVQNGTLVRIQTATYKLYKPNELAIFVKYLRIFLLGFLPVLASLL